MSTGVQHPTRVSRLTRRAWFAVACIPFGFAATIGAVFVLLNLVGLVGRIAGF